MKRTITPIAHIRSDYGSKFGIPRQSGLAPDAEAAILFAPEFQNADALRGLAGFSHIWLIWGFSAHADADWSPTVRPPRLGGNERVGVFATRSPFRPNNLGLSAVKLVRVALENPANAQIIVAGADLMDGTPIYDIKPYIPYTDSIPEAANGFAPAPDRAKLHVALPPELAAVIPADKRAALLQSLALDPRPAFHNDPQRVYGMEFAGLNVRFAVEDDTLRVVEITKVL
ncbi:MAG: tRNA (N6-threonylcarbamoyladenosine(37)-N6)-methyltransferase TrmO [Oscillospiraceae bacterium]|jgi:tRNA-Thr(GGU) m(6)t(6)A37 methyltransferase TsaA|nr:tRNA (N6-threonylcarbamoyladenosine(37)-N6)-methyltransferase TrmO [Oscillospiraceae bacterium]